MGFAAGFGAQDRDAGVGGAVPVGEKSRAASRCPGHLPPHSAKDAWRPHLPQPAHSKRASFRRHPALVYGRGATNDSDVSGGALWYAGMFALLALGLFGVLRGALGFPARA